MEGAEIKSGSIYISESISTRVEFCKVKWVREVVNTKLIYIPIYLNRNRTELVFVAAVDSSRVKSETESLIQRGVAFIGNYL